MSSVDEIEECYYQSIGHKSPYFRRSTIKGFLEDLSKDDILDACEILIEKRRLGFPYDKGDEHVGLTCWKYFLGILKRKVDQKYGDREEEKLSSSYLYSITQGEEE